MASARTADQSDGSLPAPVKPVPFLDLSRSLSPLRDDILAALARVVDSGVFVLGSEVDLLEKTLAEYCRCRHAIACASGSDALLLALMALGIGPGDEVIVPSFTFFATASAVTRLGATPVFADIDPHTYNVSPQHIRRLIRKKTRAIIPVHLFGQSADMAPILELAERFGLLVIEDAAQSLGAEYRGQRVGSMGRVGCLSFYPTKNLGAMGDAGMITTNDEGLAEILRILRVHGMQPRYYHSRIGINSRMDAFQAAVLRVKLPLLERWIAQRQHIAEQYTRLFLQAGLEAHLGLPHTFPDRRHVWNQYVIRVPKGQRDALRKYLQERKIGTEIYYPLGLHEQECFQFLGYAPTDLPETFLASREVLALPIYPGLTMEEQETVVQSIAAFFREQPRGHRVAPPVFATRSQSTVPDRRDTIGS